MILILPNKLRTWVFVQLVWILTSSHITLYMDCCDYRSIEA